MYSMYPVCSKALEHSTSTGGPNATLMTLEIEPGYWRASSTSREISACDNKDACKGGLTGSPDYCRKGYKGPCEFGLFRKFVAHVFMSLSVATRSVSLPYRRVISSKAKLHYILGNNCERILGSGNSKCSKACRELGR